MLINFLMLIHLVYSKRRPVAESMFIFTFIVCIVFCFIDPKI